MNEAALLANAAEDTEGGVVTALAVASRAEQRAQARYLPPGCANITRQGTVLTTVLNECTGRRGLLRMTGTVTTEFADVSEGVQLKVTSKGLKVNRAVMDLNAKGLIAVVGNQVSLTVSTQGEGVGARGNRFERTGQYTAVADTTTECLTLNGSWQLKVGAAARSTGISDLKTCKNACPASGRIEHQGFRGRGISVSFDGSAEAAWTTSRGAEGSVSLACTAAS